MLAYQMLYAQALFLSAEVELNTWILPLIWFSVIILTLIVESQTADLIAIWFAPGAFVAMILTFFDVSLLIQVLVFIGLTVLGLILTFAWVRPAMKKRHTILKTNAEALSEKIAIVEETIDNAIPSGVVKVNGQLWTARMEDPSVIAAKGDWIIIVRVEGSKLICKPRS